MKLRQDHKSNFEDRLTLSIKDTQNDIATEHKALHIFSSIKDNLSSLN